MAGNSRYQGHLPASIDEVLRAVDELEQARLGPGFPNLAQAAAGDDEVDDLVQAAAKWAKGVQRAYGIGARKRKHGGVGVLPFFDAYSGFDSPDDLPTLLGPLPADCVDLSLIGPDFTIFEYAFSHSREPHHGQARSLSDQRERGISFTLGNWEEIHRRLMLGYARVVKRSLGLANWIRTKIRELEGAIMPRVRVVGAGSHNRVRVQVTQALSVREVELTHLQAKLLQKLARDGIATASRRTKMDLLSLVPELRPWIENRPRDPGADDANEATYGVAPEVQESIWLED